jgi:hypothetical protein
MGQKGTIMKLYDVEPEDEDQDEEQQETEQEGDVLPPGPVLIESR